MQMQSPGRQRKDRSLGMRGICGEHRQFAVGRLVSAQDKVRITYFVASIASSLMNETSSRLAKPLDPITNVVVQDWAGWGEFVCRRMTMFICNEACLTQVEVRTVLARNESRSWQFWRMVRDGQVREGPRLTVNAAVACTFFEINGGRNLDLLLLLGLAWSTCLSDTWDDYAISNEALDEPVIFAVAVDAFVDAALTQVEITILADAAVIVFVGDSLATVITVNAESATEVSEAWDSRLAEVAASRRWTRGWIDVRVGGGERTRHTDSA